MCTWTSVCVSTYFNLFLMVKTILKRRYWSIDDCKLRITKQFKNINLILLSPSYFSSKNKKSIWKIIKTITASTLMDNHCLLVLYYTSTQYEPLRLLL